MKKFSLIKSRIREFADSQGIKISEIYAKTGITDGTFSNSSGITEDNLLKLFSYYNQINANWLITGEGEMLKTTTESAEKNNDTIVAQKKLIAMQEKEIARLEQELSATKSANKPQGSIATRVAPHPEELNK